MSLGQRTYIIEGDSISPLPQKKFDDFFFNERPTLRAYSGRTLTFAMPMYELEDERPARVIRLDTLRLAVKEDGSLDQDHYRRRLTDVFAAIDKEDPAEATIARERRSPQISEEARKQILAHLKIQ